MPDVSWGTLINGYGGRWLGVADGFVWAVTKQGAVWVWHQHTWTEWIAAGDYQWGSLVWSPDHTLMAVQEIDHAQRLVQLSKTILQLLINNTIFMMWCIIRVNIACGLAGAFHALG